MTRTAARPDLSLSIVNTNNRELLDKCLESIYTGSGDLSVEVIVVDNGSTDGSAEMVRTKYPQARVVENSRVLGYPASQNRGIARSTGRYILVFNEDMLVPPGALRYLVDYMDAHPGVGASGCRLLNPDGTLQPSLLVYPTLTGLFSKASYLYKIFPKHPVLGRFNKAHWDYAKEQSAEVLLGCCVLTRREVVETVGGLDERFFIYFEEVDWCRRIADAGWDLRYVPDVEIIHHGGQTTKRQSVPMYVELHRSMLKYFQKHGGVSRRRAATALLTLDTALRLLGWSLITAFGGRVREFGRYKVRQNLALMRFLVSDEPWNGRLR